MKVTIDSNSKTIISSKEFEYWEHKNLSFFW
jgi:hypothetical protein